MCFGASVLLRKASALKRIDVRYGPQNANESMGLTACTLRRKTMYKSTDYEHEQLSFINFNMACGMQLDMNNE